MTPVEEEYLRTRINLRIAELCGWKEQCVSTNEPPNYEKIVWATPAGTFDTEEELHPPNYLGSLDACTEFEVRQSAHDLYEHYLGEVTGTSALAYRRSFVGERFRMATAAPWQRCKAFLMLRGEWDLLQDAEKIFGGTTN